jgi:KaiC/GvpD/RAD55 family RecA-like ATPase
VHLGDVVESKGDILGDAVNVASRIEPMADDGGVCVTRQVFDQVRNKFELPLASLGNVYLKNVGIPIEAFRMVMPWTDEKPKPLVGSDQVSSVPALGRSVSSGIPSLDPLLDDGYPDRSTILVVGPSGIGKEALGYWFTHSGLTQGDFCLYVTRLSVKEVLQDEKGFGIETRQRVPVWLASDGGQIKYDVNDLAGLSYNIKEVLKQNAGRRIRIVIDTISSLLMLNLPETVYKFLTQLFADVKQYDAVLLATLEYGMHQPQVIAAMEQLFDGVLEMRLYEDGLRLVPLLRVQKMRGIPPQPAYFNFSLSRTGMELTPFV